MIAPDIRWVKICYVLNLVIRNGMSLSYAHCVTLMMLPHGSNTWGPLEIFTLLVHVFCTLMYFCVAPLSAIPYVCCWLGGIPLHLLRSIVLLFNFFFMLVMFSLNEPFILLFTIFFPNHHAPREGPFLLCSIQLIILALSKCPSALKRQSALS